jgi:hypothetical protein
MFENAHLSHGVNFGKDYQKGSYNKGIFIEKIKMIRTYYPH